MSNQPDESSPYVIKLRGLPFEASKNQIINFLSDIDIYGDEKGIHLISSMDGKSTGEAFVEVTSQDEIEKAKKHDRQLIKRRYIEVFECETDEFVQGMLKQKVIQRDRETIVRLRGLPYEATAEDVKNFFEGIKLKNRKNTPDIRFLKDYVGMKNGEAFVWFASPEETKKALEKNREKMGKRYIEIFRATPLEVERDIQKSVFPSLYLDKNGVFRGGNNRNMRNRPYPNFDRGGFNNGSNFRNNNFGNDNWGNNGFGGGPGFNGGGSGFNGGGSGFNNDGPGFNDGGPGFNGWGGNNFDDEGSGGSMHFNNFDGPGPCGPPNRQFDDGAFRIHMRGLPFVSDESDVREFFTPLKPICCEILYNDRGRHTGEANAYFETIQEVDDAIKRHKGQMGSRYVELFFRGQVDSVGGNRGNFGGNRGTGFGFGPGTSNRRF